MRDKSSTTPVATLAILTGMLTALFGALMLGTRRPPPTALPPEHPLFGR